jgi:multidrug resistance efflux pump
VPQIVSGAIGAVSVVDNQYVHRGDGPYAIDPERFRLAAASAQADVDDPLHLSECIEI